MNYVNVFGFSINFQDRNSEGNWNASLWKARALLNHWGQVTHICISKLTSICSNNGLSSGWHQAIIWTNAGILLIEPLRTNISQSLIEIQTFLFKKMHSKVSSKWWPFCIGLNDLTCIISHGVDLIFLEYSDFNTRRVTIWLVQLCYNPANFLQITNNMKPKMSMDNKVFPWFFYWYVDFTCWCSIE